MVRGVRSNRTRLERVVIVKKTAQVSDRPYAELTLSLSRELSKTVKFEFLKSFYIVVRGRK